MARVCILVALLCVFSSTFAKPYLATRDTASVETDEEVEMDEEQALLQAFLAVDAVMNTYTDDQISYIISFMKIVSDPSMSKEQKIEQLHLLLEPQLVNLTTTEQQEFEAKLDSLLELEVYFEQLQNNATKKVQKAFVDLDTLLETFEFYRGWAVEKKKDAVLAVFANFTIEERQEFDGIVWAVVMKSIDEGFLFGGSGELNLIVVDSDEDGSDDDDLVVEFNAVGDYDDYTFSDVYAYYYDYYNTVA